MELHTHNCQDKAQMVQSNDTLNFSIFLWSPFDNITGEGQENILFFVKNRHQHQNVPFMDFWLLWHLTISISLLKCAHREAMTLTCPLTLVYLWIVTRFWIYYLSQRWKVSCTFSWLTWQISSLRSFSTEEFMCNYNSASGLLLCSTSCCSSEAWMQMKLPGPVRELCSLTFHSHSGNSSWLL